MTERLLFDGEKETLIGYVCDVEGNLCYWHRYLAISTVLERVDLCKLKHYNHFTSNAGHRELRIDTAIDVNTYYCKSVKYQNSGVDTVEDDGFSIKGYELKLKDNCHFVYGGDVCDRGSGDIQILSDLIELKRTYPDRVHLILGNRDINKIRLKFALHPDATARHETVYWVPRESTDREFSFSQVERLEWVS